MAHELDIETLQSAIEEENARWQADETSLTRMAEEDRELHLGYEPGPNDLSLEDQERQAKANLETFMTAETDDYGYPSSADLRNGGFITPVKNQGACGSCVAFGVAAAAEGRARKQRNDPTLEVDYSEAHLFYCYAREQGRRCQGENSGWWPHKALDSFQEGVVDEACFPYTAGDQECDLCADWESRLTKITDWNRLTSTSDMKDWLATKGPLVACFSVYEDFYSYAGGIYRHVSGDYRGGHCVCCVGYNDPQQYWICKNSWGDQWGENGYFRIGYGEVGIDSSMDTVVAIAETGWVRDVQVIGLWAHNSERNTWVYIQDMGWRKISPTHDNVVFDMLTQLREAEANNSRVDFYQEEGVIKQIYVF